MRFRIYAQFFSLLLTRLCSTTFPVIHELYDVCCGSGAFEDTSFASLETLVSDSTLKAVKEMGFEHMTEIQHKSIRPLLEGR